MRRNSTSLTRQRPCSKRHESRLAPSPRPTVVAADSPTSPAPSSPAASHERDAFTPPPARTSPQSRRTTAHLIASIGSTRKISHSSSSRPATNAKLSAPRSPTIDEAIASSSRPGRGASRTSSATSARHASPSARRRKSPCPRRDRRSIAARTASATAGAGTAT
ncbi:MAG TPA: hypothetical protein VFS43_40520 [Polyangiaceae bacterium]|nr:hypothetical protein [Polyangiaceae bacterium]